VRIAHVYRIDEHAVSIFEERPPWRGFGPWTSHGVARLRFSRPRNLWTLSRLCRDLKWHRYLPAPSSVDLAGLVAIVEADECGPLFGWRARRRASIDPDGAGLS